MGAVVQFKILSHNVITILCTVLVFQSTVVVSLLGYSNYIQSVDATSATTNVTRTMKSPIVAKMLVDNAIQEFQSNNINSTIAYLKGAVKELSSSLAIVGNNNNSIGVHTSMIPTLTILLLVRSIIQSLDSGDYGKGQKYLNLAEQELGRNILDASSSLNPQTIISTSNTTFNNNKNNKNNNYSFFSTYTNTKYGIKLQYPHDWIVEADDYATGAAGRAGIQITSFYLLDINDGLPFFRIGG